MNTPTAWLLALAPFVGAGALTTLADPVPSPLIQEEDPLREIRDRDPEVRERACAVLGGLATKKGDAALVKVVQKDEDPGVVLAAIEALAERPSSLRDKTLVKAALDSPFDRVARAAARRLADGDSAAARKALVAKAKGRSALRAAGAVLELEATCHGLGYPAEEPKDIARYVKRLQKLDRSKDVRERAIGAAAAMALTRGDRETRKELIEELILDRAGVREDLAVLCAALDGMATAPLWTDLRDLLPVTRLQKQPGVVQRRLERALGKALTVVPEEHREGLWIALAAGVGGDDRRLATLVRAVHHAEGEVRASFPFATMMGSANEKLGPRTGAALAGLVRAEAARDGSALKSTPALFRDEPAARVQIVQAIGAQVRRDGAPSAEVAEGVEALARELGGSNDQVAIAAAVALGCEAAGEAGAAALAEAISSADSTLLRVAALISLGRTRQEAALEVLVKTIEDDGDWRARAAAAQGLRHLSTDACIEPLSAAAVDRHPAVAATAVDALRWFAGSLGDDVEPGDWASWWKGRPGHGNFKTREERDDLAEAYGYGVSDAEIYAGLDVVVIPGRGDKVEAVLDRLGITYRTVPVGKLQEAALTPESVLLVGCAGEISPGDRQMIRWFVHAGGALFTSCWALSHTVEPAFPAIVSKAATPGEVLDTVFAERAPGAMGSPYLRGVFDGGVRPFYSLVGAHLIHVVDPDRAHVLLDSPECATRHGAGTLAAWFQAGHGVVLDTANHLEEQGFASAVGLSKPAERQAFAVNHLGMTVERLRECADEKWWKGTSSAAEHVSDLSVFRILTGFVRAKRIGR